MITTQIITMHVGIACAKACWRRPVFSLIGFYPLRRLSWTWWCIFHSSDIARYISKMFPATIQRIALDPYQVGIKQLLLQQQCKADWCFHNFHSLLSRSLCQWIHLPRQYQMNVRMLDKLVRLYTIWWRFFSICMI